MGESPWRSEMRKRKTRNFNLKDEINGLKPEETGGVQGDDFKDVSKECHEISFKQPARLEGRHSVARGLVARSDTVLFQGGKKNLEKECRGKAFLESGASKDLCGCKWIQDCVKRYLSEDEKQEINENPGWKRIQV